MAAMMRIRPPQRSHLRTSTESPGGEKSDKGHAEEADGGNDGQQRAYDGMPGGIAQPFRRFPIRLLIKVMRYAW